MHTRKATLSPLSQRGNKTESERVERGDEAMVAVVRRAWSWSETEMVVASGRHTGTTYI